MPYLAESDHTLFWSHDTPLEHQIVAVHHSIVRETTLEMYTALIWHSYLTHSAPYHWSDPLLCAVIISRCVAGVLSLANAVDLLVDLSAMVIALLSSSGH